MNTNSKTFCIAPYKHLCTTPTGTLRICANSAEVKDQFGYKDLESFYHSDMLKKLRNDHLNGIRNPICKRCYIQEDAGNQSYRQSLNDNITDGDLKKTVEDPDTSNITSIDLNIGYHCNLKCIMCSAKYSSEITKELNANPELESHYTKIQQEKFLKVDDDNFLQWCKDTIKSATHLKISGGEAVINPILYELLDQLPQKQKEKCILHLHTNLTVLNDKLLNYFKQFKNTWLNVSFEGIGDVLEYARFPASWHNLEKNLDLLLKHLDNKIHLEVTYVIQSPTFAGILPMIEYFDNKNLTLNPLFLDSPEHFHIKSIKTTYKKELLEKLIKYRGPNLKFVHEIVTFIKQNLDYDQSLAKKCVLNLQKLDKIRNNDFQKIIPLDYFI